MAVTRIDLTYPISSIHGPDATGYVVITPRHRILDLDDNVLLDPVPIVSDLVDGDMPTVEVVASDSDDITPQNVTYRVKVHVDGVGTQRWNLFVPASSYPTLNLATVTPLAEIPDLVYPDADLVEIVNHKADPADAHDASAISVVPAGTLAATTVQAALAELDAEKLANGAGAGGVLSGSLPNPGFAVDMVEQSELTAAINAVINAAPGALDTLDELAAALGDDANFATTITNLVAAKVDKATLDAKGDVLTATANDTPARLAVGANDTVLTADSSASTGLKWAAPTASTFAPTDLGAALVGWWKPESLGSNGSPITTWPDSSPAGHVLTQAASGKRPTVVTNVLNGFSCARFDGVDDFLQASYACSVPEVVFALYKIVVGVTNAVDIDGVTAGYRALRENNTSGSVSFITGFGNENAVFITTMGTTHYRLMTMISNGDRSLLRMDEDEARSGPGNIGPDLNAAGMTFGATGAGTGPAQVDFIEVIHVTGLPTPTNRRKVEDYFGDKYDTW